MNHAGVWTMFVKEVVDNVRDRRTLMSALFFGPLFGPVFFAVIMSMTLKMAISDSEKSLEVPVLGAEFAPNLLSFLSQNNLEPLLLGVDVVPEDLVRDGERAFVLVIPEKFAADFLKGSPAMLRLVTDKSDRDAGKDVSRVTSVLKSYQQRIALLRLQARGISPTVSLPVVIEQVDVSTPSARSVLILGMVTYFLFFATLMGGLYLAIDSTAGERERGSLEPLLTLPVSRAQLLGGKLAATCAFMVLSLLLTLVAFAVSLRYLPLEEVGMSANFGPLVVFKAFLVVLPFVLFGAALLTLVASFTRSYKEAQSYLSFVLLVPTLPIVFAGLYALKASAPLMLVPSLSQHLLITELMKGEPLNLVHAGISAGGTVALACVLTVFAARLYGREAILG
ncbi:MAG: ABC transporter permease [Gammaproteobacteria bacterium]|nr:ABC transporter permease [Gammaproteobacteria bacterium]